MSATCSKESFESGDVEVLGQRQVLQALGLERHVSLEGLVGGDPALREVDAGRIEIDAEHFPRPLLGYVIRHRSVPAAEVQDPLATEVRFAAEPAPELAIGVELVLEVRGVLRFCGLTGHRCFAS